MYGGFDLLDHSILVKWFTVESIEKAMKYWRILNLFTFFREDELDPESN